MKVLVAEDDLLIADALEDVLARAGFEVCGIARTVSEAVELAEQYAPEFAVLDLRLAEGGVGTEIVERFPSSRRIGILYATGTTEQPSLTRTHGDALISKPYQPRDIIRALNIIRQIIDGDEPSLPFPPGFALLREPTPSAPRVGREFAKSVVGS